jgi:hypothetical protein
VIHKESIRVPSLRCRECSLGWLLSFEYDIRTPPNDLRPSISPWFATDQMTHALPRRKETTRSQLVIGKATTAALQIFPLDIIGTRDGLHPTNFDVRYGFYAGFCLTEQRSFCPLLLCLASAAVLPSSWSCNFKRGRSPLPPSVPHKLR